MSVPADSRSALEGASAAHGKATGSGRDANLAATRFRKKPVMIEAVQWTGDMAPVIALVGHDLPTYGPSGQSGSIRIATLEGDHECRLGDWIIKGIQGEFYPVKPDIFEETYEPAD